MLWNFTDYGFYYFFDILCFLHTSCFFFFFHFSKEVIATELEEIERDEKVRFKWFKGETCMLLESRKVEKMQVCRGGGEKRRKIQICES
jgi:hypothetical protein